MRVYNLFRSKGPEPLYCAVPEAYPVPIFLTDRSWEFSGRVESEPRLVGFDRRAAALGALYNGYHLFPDFREDRVR